jgi:nitrogen fixation protein
MPRKKKPRIARLDQVRISREGEDAIIEFLDAEIATTHLRIGPEVGMMTDEDILLLFNQVIAAQIRNRDELGEYVAVEVPVGSSQVERFPGTMTEWVPRGGVLRCVIEDGGGEDGTEPVIHVDDREFTLEEFGGMLLTYAGWGMRVVFVPDDELERTPKTVVREPDDERKQDEP